MDKYLPLNLQLFAEEETVETGVEDVPAAEVQTETVEAPTGEKEEAAAEPEKQNNFEKAFAKRLAAKEAEWEAKVKEQYKDYDVSKKAMEFLQRTSGISDPMTLKEKLELADLEAKAEKENLTVEELQRRQELDELKAWKSEVETKQQEEQKYQEFRTNLEAFAKENNVDADQFHQFMHDNQIGKMDVALKAMKYDEVVNERDSAEKEGVKKFLAAKGSIPTVEGKTASGTVSTATPKSFADARSRAMQRLSNWGNMEG